MTGAPVTWGMAVPRVLVVDDDDAVRSLVEDVLLLEGYDVETAADGLAALAAVEAQRPDAVVLDVMMPGLDGHEVLRRLRAAEGGLDLPVVMLTAAADDEQAWQAWTGGVDWFLPKPFHADDLLRWLEQLFAGARVDLQPAGSGTSGC